MFNADTQSDEPNKNKQTCSACTRTHGASCLLRLSVYDSVTLKRPSEGNPLLAIIQRRSSSCHRLLYKTAFTLHPVIAFVPRLVLCVWIPSQHDLIYYLHLLRVCVS